MFTQSAFKTPLEKLRSDLISKVHKYIIDHPKPLPIATFLGVKIEKYDSHKDGRIRADKYKPELEQISEDHLLKTVVADYIFTDKNLSNLESSNDLRKEIGAVLCNYLGISEKEIGSLAFSKAYSDSKGATGTNASAKNARHDAISDLLLNKINMNRKQLTDYIRERRNIKAIDLSPT